MATAQSVTTKPAPAPSAPKNDPKEASQGFNDAMTTARTGSNQQKSSASGNSSAQQAAQVQSSNGSGTANQPKSTTSGNSSAQQAAQVQSSNGSGTANQPKSTASGNGSAQQTGQAQSSNGSGTANQPKSTASGNGSAQQTAQAQSSNASGTANQPKSTASGNVPVDGSNSNGATNGADRGKPATIGSSEAASSGGIAEAQRLLSSPKDAVNSTSQMSTTESAHFRNLGNVWSGLPTNKSATVNNYTDLVNAFKAGYKNIQINGNITADKLTTFKFDNPSWSGLRISSSNQSQLTNIQFAFVSNQGTITNIGIQGLNMRSDLQLLKQLPPQSAKSQDLEHNGGVNFQAISLRNVDGAYIGNNNIRDFPDDLMSVSNGSDHVTIKGNTFDFSPSWQTELAGRSWDWTGQQIQPLSGERIAVLIGANDGDTYAKTGKLNVTMNGNTFGSNLVGRMPMNRGNLTSTNNTFKLSNSHYATLQNEPGGRITSTNDHFLGGVKPIFSNLAQNGFSMKGAQYNNAALGNNYRMKASGTVPINFS